MTALSDDGHALVASFAQITQQILHIQFRSDDERAPLAGDFGQCRGGFIQTVRTQHHDWRVVFHHATKHTRTLGQQFRVDQGIVHHLPEAWQIQRRALPHAEFGMYMILRLHVCAENPHATARRDLLRVPHHERRRKAEGLRRDVIEHQICVL